MEITRNIPSEPLPGRKESILSEVTNDNITEFDSKDLAELTEGELIDKVETFLLDKIKAGDKQALFQLGQFYFEQEKYESAFKYFDRAVKTYDDWQSMYELGVMCYDGLGCETDYKRAIEMLERVATSTAPQAKHLKHAAQYNLGRAHFQGFGVRPQSDSNAEKWWLLAADDGNPKANIKAQTMLGMFYSREDSKDLKKAFFWHSEACGNGSLESQGALGVMYDNGLGVTKDEASAFECLKEAAERGNVYAMGLLIQYYYKRKLYTKSADLAARVALLRDIDEISKEIDCLPGFTKKGISMAAFYYARALEKGHGLKQDIKSSEKMYSKAYAMDPDMCARLQNITQHGQI